MSPSERLRQLVAVLPSDGSITLTRATLEAWLSEDAGGDEGTDLTTAEVAIACGVSENTARRWCATGQLRAYRPGGRGWRITPQGLAEFRHGGQRAPQPVDLRAWRTVRRT